jgi:hypothetical protein
MTRAEHRLPFPGCDGWNAWRWVCVRGAGFPARLAHEMASPELGRLVDAFLDLGLSSTIEATQDPLAESAQRGLMQAIRSAHGAARGAVRVVLRNSLRWLRGTRLPLVLPDSAHHYEAARATFLETSLELRRSLYRLAARADFREAVCWQNPRASQTLATALSGRPQAEPNHGQRRNELLAVRYLQRYCTKNDSIGFFGPVGWGELAESEPALRSVPGPSLLASRKVFFEHWAIDAVAGRLAADPRLRLWCPPRRMPTVHLDGHVLSYPVGQTAVLDRATASLLRLCDGTSAATAVAGRLVASEPEAFPTPETVYAALADLEQDGVITWTFEVPTQVQEPEAALLAQLSGVGHPPSAAHAQDLLRPLLEAREHVAAAAGDPERLATALARFDGVFQELTAQASHRSAGRTYASRTPLYEDALRNVDVTIGTALIGRVGPVLGLLLQSARWLSHHLAATYRSALEQTHQGLAREATSVDLVPFLDAALPLFAGERGALPPVAAPVLQEFQRRWAAVLQLDDETPARRSVASLAGPVAEAFAAPGFGWPGAACHSPDLMLAAANGLDSIARGEYTIVLGELHLCANTLLSPALLHQHPNAEELIAAYARDSAVPRIAPVYSRHIGGLRVAIGPWSPRDFHVELGDTRSPRDRAHVLAAGSLVVEKGVGGLRVRSRDGACDFEVIDFFEHFLSVLASRFELAAAKRHTPRVVVDGVVITRERWVLEPGELCFLREANDFDQFQGARRLRLALGMPERVFVRTPEEPKPFFVDFSSPLLIQMWAGMTRDGSGAVVSEMLPDLTEGWLTDASGNVYTAELRLAVVADPC